MRKFYTYSALLVLIFCSFGLTAQKFGYVNTQELISQIPEVKEANSNIETFRTQLQKKGQEMLKSLQSKYQELERKQAQGEIAPKQLDIEVQKLKDEEESILNFEQESQQRIIEKSETLLKPLRDKIQKAISDVAAEHNYDYIFDYSSGFVLYAQESTNVGALVKAKIGM
jgi:outer membrane protein